MLIWLAYSSCWLQDPSFQGSGWYEWLNTDMVSICSKQGKLINSTSGAGLQLQLVGGNLKKLFWFFGGFFFFQFVKNFLRSQTEFLDLSRPRPHNIHLLYSAGIWQTWGQIPDSGISHLVGESWPLDYGARLSLALVQWLSIYAKWNSSHKAGLELHTPE